ncbi:S-layer homology domain-containing protein [Clostridia bacterium]|nr:S-layer homology domain-containing protein [Clostridia bacterium]
MNNNKSTAGILALSLLSGVFLTGFTYQQGIENVYYETQSEIFDNTTYYEQLAGHSVNGIERAYYVQADTNDTELKPYVFEGEVTGTYTMDTMINTIENQGYTVVAGINGDVYDTASGVPKGLSIHDYKIKTSGYAPEYVIAFDEKGLASLEKVNLRYTLKGTINVPTVATTTFTNPIIQEGPIKLEENVIEQPKIISIPTEYNADIGYFNVKQGGAKALHLFNRQYAPSTKTTNNSVEVVLDAGSVEGAKLTVGGTITATVVEVKNDCHNTPIGDNQLVLSTVTDSASALKLAQLVPGSKVELSVYDKNSGNLANSKEAIGVYYVLYHNNQFVSSGTNINPRTIIGIKPDGTLLLYVLDGRQSGFSEGLGLTDVAKHLVDLGCSTVVNMDGGGSSVMGVREGGIDSKAVMKNSPSSQSQRKTTNGLFLVYDLRGNSDVVHLHTYPSQPLAMPGADIQLRTYASNNQYEQVALKKDVEYSLDSGSGSFVDKNGLFTAGTTTGTTIIEAESDELSTRTKIDIQNNITFTTNVQSLVIDSEEKRDINVTAKFGYAPIASKDSLFTWTCDSIIGTIDVNGLFKATNESGISGNIYVEYNGAKRTIPVQVGVASIDFADTKTHWASNYIGKLAARGIVNGVDNKFYLPDDFLTRAQFLTMLANTISGLDVAKATPAGFTDVPTTQWYTNYVNWGFETGIVRGIDDTTFAPNEKITREQMAVMMDNFTNSIDLVLQKTDATVSFTDGVRISPWAADSVDKIVFAGIMRGYPEGDYKPQGDATRAEAASVVYQLITIRDKYARQ